MNDFIVITLASFTGFTLGNIFAHFFPLNDRKIDVDNLMFLVMVLQETLVKKNIISVDDLRDTYNTEYKQERN